MSRFFWTILLCCITLTARAQDADVPADAADESATPAAEPAPAGPSPEAVAAKAAFDPIIDEWRDLNAKIEDVRAKRKDAKGDAKTELDAQFAELAGQAYELIDKIVDAGIAVYKADPKAYPEINATLLAIAQYHITGDAKGDGGDQYEKALAVIDQLIAAGAAEDWPQLYLWGAISAYCTNDFPKAKAYFAKAEETGGNASGSTRGILEQAAQYQSSLPALEKAWEKEKAIRDAEAQADDLPRVKLTTSQGDIVIELFENEAPETVANFITLVKKGFYDGVVFHRVLPQFMAQGGDPTGTGGGGPGYSIKCECHKPEYRRHFRGSLSMAHAGRDTGGSQFFLTFVPTSFLDGKHTAFGRVVEGMDVMAGIRRRDPDNPVGEPERILKAEVLRDRGHEYTFQKLPGR
jgi:cyclophilin family peptidyl-prolyl cis-trans isomerase